MKHILITTIAAVLLVGCGESPKDIWEAAKQGNLEAVKQHLADGADVNAKDKYGLTPLHHAAWQGRNEIVELLIANGADVNAKDVDGGTPLHEAASDGRKEVVELLIDNGADVNVKDDRGMTPLDWAEGVSRRDLPEVKASKKGIADLLRKHGAKTSGELKAEGN
ncbi:ankyrin repeat domain-containing protein [bacterium]|nr:ankyrin repeat domain-containing protein [bacterium]